MFSWKTVTIAIYFDSMLATRFFCPSTSKILSNQNRFVAHLLLALSNSPYPRGCVEPFFLKRTYGEYKKTGRQIALSARLLSYGAKGRLDKCFIDMFLLSKIFLKNNYTNGHTNNARRCWEFECGLRTAGTANTAIHSHPYGTWVRPLSCLDEAGRSTLSLPLA